MESPAPLMIITSPLQSPASDTERSPSPPPLATNSSPAASDSGIGSATEPSPDATNQEYDVEEITEYDPITEEYYVKWLKYPAEDNTWEPIDNLLNCIIKVNEF